MANQKHVSIEYLMQDRVKLQTYWCDDGGEAA